MATSEHRWHHVVPGDGASPCDVLFVGTMPGVMETEEGRAFASPHGVMLREVVHDVIGESVWFTNMVNQMRTVEGVMKPPPKQALQTGRDRISNEINIREPKVVVAVGAIPTAWLTGLNLRLPRDHGQPIKSRVMGTTVVPIFDPAYVGRRGGLLGKVGNEWLADIELVRDLVRNA